MELSELQDKVQKEYAIIKASKFFAKEDYQKSVDNAGCLLTPFIPLIELYAKRGLKKKHQNEVTTFMKSKPTSFLKNSELRKEICSSLILITQKEILTEENFINYITAILYENKIRTKFIIPLEPALVTYIAFNIFDTGINNFCSENNEL